MAEIKISDLSVGDWIAYNGKKYRIKEISSPYASVTLWGNNEQRDESIVLIEPIPLTPEILEKNGFSHNGNKWYTPELFTLERWSKGWTIIIACSCGDYVCEVCTIKYVHQLQHALRLAGVEKEIEL